jgi:hypothetical protein
MRKIYLLFLAAIIVNVAPAQSIQGTSFSILKSDGTFNGDATYFQRFDVIDDRTELRLNLGDEYTSDFKIGYHFYLDGLWYTNFGLDGYGNGYFRGSLGIGQLNPETDLHLEKNLNGELSLLIKNTFGEGARTYLTSMPGKSLIQTDKDFAISTNGGGWTDKFILKNNGNIGIGITNPTEKLVVAGKILAMEVKVQNVPASDYVFEPDYNLLSLHEVETFIKENKHLPDIPSAAEFKENGVGLGEMDNMLLRKVEELTLYMIEMQKQMDELKAENETLKQKIAD